MTTSARMLRPLTAAVFLFCGAAALGQRDAEDLDALEQQAMQSAVDRVAASVVRIETVGGLEKVRGVLFGTGPTTGLVVSPDGYIISSAFNFAQRPTSILIGLPDGTRTPARLVATDFNRMLALLKVDVEEELTVAEIAPREETRVGQWAIAVGRTFPGGELNRSVGIVSAVNRIWGNAVQTDAKVSPSNYGGPLLDIHGRVLGVLVPLSPEGSSQVAGAEWYDSGIGFAIPLDDVMEILPRLKEGEDLHHGIMGVSLRTRNRFSDPAVIAACRVNSPAYKAGLKAGDRVIEIDSEPISTQIDLKSQLGGRYAGDTIQVAVLRGEERIERELTLTDKLEPYEHPFLGILPMRPRTSADGVRVRYVYKDSPADRIGIAAGDTITAFAEEELTSAGELLEKLNAHAAGDRVTIGFRHGAETLNREVVLATLPTALPGELPPGRDESESAPAEENVGGALQTGKIELKIPEFQNECLAYVPENYDPGRAHGIVLWLHAPGGFDDDELVARWESICRKYALILLAPKASDPARWQPNELEFIRKVVDQVRSTYNIDPARIVAHGEKNGGVVAYVFAFANRDLIRAAAAVDAPPVGNIPDNDPLLRLAIYSAGAKNSRFARQIQAGLAELSDMKYPVSVKPLGDEPRELNDLEREELARWIDTLDRL